MTRRLPVVGSDDGTWGTLLNDFLNKEHEDVTPGSTHADSGRHKTITIKAGTATAGTAPLKFTSGTVLSTPEAGCMEFTTDSLYFTITTGTVRKTIAWADGSNITGVIQNGTSVQSNANFAIQSASSSSKVAVVRGAAAQSANLQEWQNSAGTALAFVDVNGSLAGNYLGSTAGGPYINASTGTTMQVTNQTTTSNVPLSVKGMASQSGDLQQWQNSSSTTLSKIDSAGNLSVGTSTSPTGGVAAFNGNVGVGNTSPSARLHVTTPAASTTGFWVTDATNYTLASGYKASGVGFFGGLAGSQLSLQSNNAETMRLDSSNRVGIGTDSPSTLLHVGKAGTTLGTVGLAGNTSGLVTVQPAAAAGTWTMTLPTGAGSNGQVLQTNGSGVTSWVTPASTSDYTNSFMLMGA